MTNVTNEVRDLALFLLIQSAAAFQTDQRDLRFVRGGQLSWWTEQRSIGGVFLFGREREMQADGNWVSRPAWSVPDGGRQDRRCRGLVYRHYSNETGGVAVTRELEELQRFNRVAVCRESRMLEEGDQ